MQTQQKKILVVDDFQSVRGLLCRTLEQNGYPTEIASDGQDALKTLQRQSRQFCLVLSDFNMPNMDGLGLLEGIRNMDRTRNLPVVFLTTERDPQKMKRAKELGLSAWIQKPYNVNSFISQIEHALKGQHAMS